MVSTIGSFAASPHPRGTLSVAAMVDGSELDRASALYGHRMDVIDPPETALAADVRRLLDQCAPVIAAHSERSYQFAAAFAATDGVGLDDEVLYLGTVLHDVGLSPAAEGSERFEVRGANLMRTLLLDHGMERPGRERLGLHRDARFDPARPAQESRDPLRATVASRSTRGSGAEALEPALVRAVLDRWPRTTSPPSSKRCWPTRCAPIPTRFACRGWSRLPRSTCPASCRPTSSPASAHPKDSPETRALRTHGGATCRRPGA